MGLYQLVGFSSWAVLQVLETLASSNHPDSGNSLLNYLSNFPISTLTAVDQMFGV